MLELRLLKNNKISILGRKMNNNSSNNEIQLL